MEPATGFEPATYALRMRRSTSWAIPAWTYIYYRRHLGLSNRIFPLLLPCLGLHAGSGSAFLLCGVRRICCVHWTDFQQVHMIPGCPNAVSVWKKVIDPKKYSDICPFPLRLCVLTISTKNTLHWSSVHNFLIWWKVLSILFIQKYEIILFLDMTVSLLLYSLYSIPAIIVEQGPIDWLMMGGQIANRKEQAQYQSYKVSFFHHNKRDPPA